MLFVLFFDIMEKKARKRLTMITFKKVKITLIILAALIITACEDYPKDPRKTLQNVREDTLRVAFSDNSYWIKKDNKRITGIEAEIIKKFAKTINAEIEWINGSESELMPMIKIGEYHIFIGGLTKDTPWKKHVGLTNPYLTTKVFVGVAPGVPIPENIKNKKIAVKKGNSFGMYVKKKEGFPHYVDYFLDNDYIAAYEWEILKLGYLKTDIILHEEKHVMAVPKGENALLMELEKFLEKNVRSK